MSAACHHHNHHGCAASIPGGEGLWPLGKQEPKNTTIREHEKNAAPRQTRVVCAYYIRTTPNGSLPSPKRGAKTVKNHLDTQTTVVRLASPRCPSPKGEAKTTKKYPDTQTTV